MTEKQCAVCADTKPIECFDDRKDETKRAICKDCVAARRDSKRLDWLQEHLVDTIYLDDGKIIDVRGGDVRRSIDNAMRAHGQSSEQKAGENKL